MKYFKKISKIIISISLFLLINISSVYAAGLTLENMESQTEAFSCVGKSAASGKFNNVVTSLSDNFVGIGQILTYIGVGVLIATITYLGIQYFISSPDKQAELKEKMIALLIATVIIFGAYNIWKLVLNVVKNFD